ncbi:PAS domain S-box protein [Desulfolithobacter sp.]
MLGYQSPGSMSIASRIRLFNRVIGLAFLLMVLVMILSLSYTRQVLVNSVTGNLETVIKNAQVSRDLARLIAESNLLFHTFYGQREYLKTKGDQLLQMSGQIVHLSTDPELKRAANHLGDHIRSILSRAAELNSLLDEKKRQEQAIFKEIDMLDEIIAEQTINQIFAGRDTSFTEQLSVQLLDYRYRLLETGKKFSELANGYRVPEEEKKDLRRKLDELIRDLQIMAVACRETSEHGSRLLEQVTTYRDLLDRYQQKWGDFEREIKEFSEARAACLSLLRKMDMEIADSTRDADRHITGFFLGTGVFLLVIALLGVISVIIATKRFLHSTINEPMEKVREALTAFTRGDLATRVKMHRFDEWSQIEKMLNTMAEELLASRNDLQQSEERYREIFNSPSDAILIHDVQTGEIVDVNQAMLEMFGYTYEEALAQNFGTLSVNEPPYTFDDAFEKITRSIEYGPQRFDWRSRRKNGELFWSEVGLRYRKFAGKRYVVAVVRDITERKKAEELLAAERERLAVTLRSIGDGVIATDTDGSIALLNRVAEQLTGWSSDEARGRPASEVFNIVNEKTGEPCENPIQRVLETGKIIGLANHTVLIARDGTRRSIADSGAPICDSQSRIIGVVLVFRDVTSEKRMEEELLKVKKLESVGVLAAGIAHDFNNILAAVLGNIDLAARLVSGEEKASRLLSEARKATSRASRLTQQLLTFAKGGDPVRETATLPQLIREAADFVLHGSQVSCEYDIPDDLWPVSVDVGQISQVIQNIIINARHAMPEGGLIKVSCANVEDVGAETFLSIPRGRFVKITVRDHGTGIPSEIIDKIFDPYYTTKQEGSGLGLAICHSIITKHDGYIQVHSEPGQGTVFDIYLPASEQVGPEGREIPDTVSAATGARIMVMDDEEMLRSLVASQLAHLGHEAILVRDGEEAVRRYKELREAGTPVDLVIMDLTIPGGMGGREALRRILEVDPEARVIVASGYSNDPVLANCREYGFVASVAKPFDLKELQTVISSVL